jgi:hypothetical protein
MALKEAVEEALNRGISQVIFESDSKSVVEALASRRVDLSEFSSIIAHIKSLVMLSPNFGSNLSSSNQIRLLTT